MILLTPESDLSGIILVNKRQGISCAEWRVCGKGHVSAIVTHNCANCPMHRLGGLPFHFHQGMSILNELHNGAHMPHWSLASSNNKPDAGAFQCSTLCIWIQKDQNGSGVAVMCGYTPLTIRETETLMSNNLYI